MLPPKPRLRINSEDLIEDGPPSSIVSSESTTPSQSNPSTVDNSLNCSVENKNPAIIVLDHADSTNISIL